MTPPPPPASQRLIKVVLDEATVAAASRDVEHERAIALYDLIEDNSFAPLGHECGPYCLTIARAGSRLILDIRTADGQPVITHHLSLAPFRRIVKDYFLICDSYYQAIRGATPSRIEAIDMGRRSLHDEASELLMERLKDKIAIDFETARRLFTLLTVLHWKG